MPSPTDKIPLASEFLDRRVKMIACKRERCYALHHEEGMGIRALARMFGVDKRLIQFVCYPERATLNKEHRKARGGSAQYYETERNTQAMREHRQYKRKVIKPKKQ